jgi:ABC-type dipeptide/oligopeptide/nickel transport system ATPase component
MRALMTANELITFAGHLRKNIDWQGASIPINSIGILIGASGSGKGRSLSSIQNVLKPAVKVIEANRLSQAKANAVQLAEDAGKNPEKWRDFYSPPRDLVVAVSTLPGWVKHLNGLESGKLGAGTLYVDELASELSSSKDLMELLTSLSILYDVGHLPVKALKSDENQGKTVDNLPVSALLFGSPYGLIYNEATKKKFMDEASSKLARRSIVCFSREEESPQAFSSIKESRDFANEESSRIEEAAIKLSPWFTELVSSTSHVDLTVSQEVADTFSDYKNYNSILSSKISMLHPLAKIHRQHRQWAALKIAGALAVLEGDIEIKRPHFVEAINFLEMFVDDLEELENELNKEPYELFSDYMLSIAEKGYANMSIHSLRKMGFVKGTGSPQAKMLELIDLAKSYDDTNKYEYSDGYIHFYEGADEDNIREELA